MPANMHGQKNPAIWKKGESSAKTMSIKHFKVTGGLFKFSLVT
jgi:phosphoribosyl-AMP cyclohydrolase